jgi:hypothetical protein
VARRGVQGVLPGSCTVAAGSAWAAVTVTRLDGLSGPEVNRVVPPQCMAHWRGATVPRRWQWSDLQTIITADTSSYSVMMSCWLLTEPSCILTSSTLYDVVSQDEQRGTSGLPN